MSSSSLKRLLDLLVFFVGLPFVLPIILLTTIVLTFTNKGKIFFFQERPGKDNKVFKLVKFKSMLDLTDDNGNVLPDDKRLTAFGRFLRSTSIDELPTLWNVLCGDMSFVGPRPLLVQYLELYDDFQIRRHQVKPGITGWAQINGRNCLSWEQKFKHDIWYVDNRSLMLDIKILFLTIIKVLKREGINQSDNETMAKFKGTR